MLNATATEASTIDVAEIHPFIVFDKNYNFKKNSAKIVYNLSSILVIMKKGKILTEFPPIVLNISCRFWNLGGSRTLSI